MKYLLIFCTCLISIASTAQNLLSNSNFAADSSCPWGASQMNYCLNWRQATFGTPDYFNSCTTTPNISVPQSGIGYQVSASNAYAGFYTYCGEATTVPDYKEYIRTTFAPLQVTATYKVTMTVSLSDSSFFASDGLGVFFSTYVINKNTLTTLAKIPQIDYSSYGIISDKVNWVTITKNFVADSAYTNLVIGNFKTNSVVNKSIMPYYGVAAGSADSFAYYFVDSVSVERIAGPTFTPANPDGDIIGLSPNPFNDFSTLTFNNDSRNEYTLHIYDIQGRLVRKMGNITTGSIKIDRGNLEPGFYYYKLYGSNDIVGNGRFLIKD